MKVLSTVWLLGGWNNCRSAPTEDQHGDLAQRPMMCVCDLDVLLILVRKSAIASGIISPKWQNIFLV